MYENMSRQLRAMANPSGSTVERLVHVMLRALELRMHGGAAALINTVPVTTEVHLVHSGTPEESTLEYTRAHQRTPGYTRVHSGTPGNTRAHQGTPGHTR